MVRFTPGCNCCGGICDQPQECTSCNDDGIPDPNDGIYADLANMPDFTLQSPVNFMNWFGSGYFNDTFQMDVFSESLCCFYQFIERINNPHWQAGFGDTPHVDAFVQVDLEAGLFSVGQVAYNDDGTTQKCSRSAVYSLLGATTACQSLDETNWSTSVSTPCTGLAGAVSFTGSESIRVFIL